MESTGGDDLPGALAIVTDVAATWDDYVPRHLVGGTVPGLILHVAGPTDDGVRMITVWATAEAWHRYRDSVSQPFDGLVVPPVVRQLKVGHLVSSPTPSTGAASHEH